MAERDRTIEAHGDRPARVLVCSTLGPWFRENVGASGDASYTTRQMTPTAATTYDTDINVGGYRAATAGVVVRAYLWANAARSAGSATVRVRITDGSGTMTDYDLADCTLDGATAPDGYVRDRKASAALAVGAGIPFAAGDAIDVRIVTAGTFGPTTADFGVQLVIVEEEEVAP
jgi:opacity protein-like surface antigen